MLVSDFDFSLPRELIAESPVFPRDSSRLLQISNDKLIDNIYSNIYSLLNAGDVLVFNDTKVIPARLYGFVGAAKIEITLHKNISDGIWKVFAKPARKLKIDSKFIIADDFYAKVLHRDEGEVTLEFCVAGEEFYKN